MSPSLVDLDLLQRHSMAGEPSTPLSSALPCPHESCCALFWLSLFSQVSSRESGISVCPQASFVLCVTRTLTSTLPALCHFSWPDPWSTSGVLSTHSLTITLSLDEQSCDSNVTLLYSRSLYSSNDLQDHALPPSYRHQSVAALLQIMFSQALVSFVFVVFFTLHATFNVLLLSLSCKPTFILFLAFPP